MSTSTHISETQSTEAPQINIVSNPTSDSLATSPKKIKFRFSSKIFTLYLLILCWAPLPLGSNRIWSWSLLSILCFALGIVMLLQAIKGKVNILDTLKQHKPVLFLFALIPTWVTLQCIPLPHGIIEMLSPNAALLSPTWQTLSIEASFTQQMAMLTWAYWIFFVMTLLLVDNGKRLRLLLSVIVLGGLFQALYGSFMTLTNTEYSFFIPKEAYIGNATGTFINRNHFAGYLEMCLSVGIGLLVASMGADGSKSLRQHLRQFLDTLLGPKIRLRIYLAVMVIALVLSRSRMGNTAFFASLPICGMLMMMLQGKINRNAIFLFLSLLLIDFFIVGQWFGFEELAQRLQGTSAEAEPRDEIVRDTWVMIKDYPVTGTGGGTFYASFPQYSGTDISRNYFTHTHNDYLEMVSTFGVFGSIPLVLIVLISLYASIRALYERHDNLMRGAAFASLMGVMCLLIHSFVDFNLQIPANALLFIVLLGIANISRSLRGNNANISTSGLSIG